MISESERDKILNDWNATGIDFPADRCLHHFLEARALDAADAIAVRHGAARLTYAELDRRANQLAHYLRRAGAGPDIPVAISLERSLEMVVGLYGILKAGSCYVPLDPDYPAARLQLMLADVGAPILLTQSSLLARLPTAEARTVLIDADWNEIAREPQSAVASGVTPEHLAYIIYTSGSTGRPKGAMLNHRGRVNNFADFNRRYDVGPDDAVLGLASLSFDMHAYDTYGTAMAGGTLVIVGPEDVNDPARWAKLIQEQAVTIWHSVPALLGLYVDHIEPRPETVAPGLRLVLLGGDWIPVSLPDRLKALVPGIQCVSMGGATECSMDSTIYDINDPSSDWKSIPYGVPMANQTGYILDRRFDLLPIGGEGELFLGGIGVGRGYFNQPALTAAKFMPDPFSSVPGARLYRTGDLVRYYPDDSGNLELLGRIDFMVKVRGFRVEIGEIESTARRHPAVKECLVMLRQDPGLEPRLVAYLLQNPDYAGDDANLQTDQVDEWRQVYESAYQRPAVGGDPTFNIVSWDSSYTNEPIAAAEMQEWVENTVGRIRAFQPRRVLEIGCGTGLLLFRIAPHTERYVGTDFAPTAVDYVRQHLANQGLSEIVELYEQGAENFDRFADDAFDAVVLNSIVMDFPSGEYLLDVIAGAQRVVAPGGIIFIGDVRGLDLLEVFHTSVQAFKIDGDRPVSELRRRVERQVRGEEELLLHPAFFTTLPGRLPRIGAAQIELKEGRFGNEMIRYRYDVTLRVGPAPDSTPIDWLDWREAGLTLPRLDAQLQNAGAGILGLAGIPNARLSADVRLHQLLTGSPDDTTVAAITRQAGEAKAINPAALWQTGRSHGYRVIIQPGIDPGLMDAVLIPGGQDEAFWTAHRWPTAPDRPLSDYASNPLRAKVARQLVPQLRRYLHQRLPEHMVPAAFVLMDAFPLNPNGKINRRAFPQPDSTRPELAAPYLAPRDRLEQLLADLWRELLGLDDVGVLDPFVLLGGHSLLATQMVSRLRDIFDIDLPLNYGFNATIADLAARLTQTGATQGRDVHQLAAGAAPAAARLTIPRRETANPPPSLLQEGIWVIENLNPDTATYNVPMVSRLRGPLDVAALDAALNEIVRRHEALRTTFVAPDNQLRQQIAPYAPASLAVVDVADLTAALDWATAAARQPFDLAQGPLYRWSLLRLGPDDHVFVAAIHHIITDGWSMGVFTRELTALYQAFSQDRPAPLAELPVQFADYAVWQRRRLDGPAGDRLRDYWHRQLSGSSFVLDLPTDRPRPALQSGQGSHVDLEIPPALTARLRELSRQQNTTLFVTLLAAFKILLAAFAGQDDVIVGTPIANRNYSELEGLIGYFVNLLPLRTNVAAAATFADLLHRVNEVTVGANMHQELPFGIIVELLRPPRDTGRNPIFQVELTLLTPENAPPVYGYGFRSPVEQTVALGPVRMTPLAVESGVSKFDLTVLLWDMPERVSGTFEYSSDLFTAETIQALAAAYQALLRAITAAPDRPVAELRTEFDTFWGAVRRRQQTERKQAAAGRLGKTRRRSRNPDST